MDDITHVPQPNETDMNIDEDMEVQTNEPPGGLLELAMMGIYQ